MGSGGYRPGAGRKKGTKNKTTDKPTKKAPLSPEAEEKKKLRELLSFDRKAKAKFYQEFLQRLGRGETLSITEKKLMDKIGAELSAELNEDKTEGKGQKGEPDAKQYLESLLVSPDIDRKTKIQIANILLPYQHSRQAEGKGKKEDKADKAKAASSGKFAPGKAPIKLVK